MTRIEADEAGTLKWFDTARGIGFIKPDSGPDVFIHTSVLRRYGIDGAALTNTPGQRLRFKTTPGVVNATPVVVAIFMD
jgi:CspA family cold shock protein